LNEQVVAMCSSIKDQFVINIKDNKVSMWDRYEATSHKWQLIEQTNNTYLIKNINNNSYLQEKGVEIVYDSNINNATKWKLVYNGNSTIGHSYTIKSSQSGKVLDVDGGGIPQNGTTIIMYNDTGNANQKFFFDFLDDDISAPEPELPEKPEAVTNLQIQVVGYDIKLSWSSVDNATDYIIYKSLNNSNYSVVAQTKKMSI